MTVHRMIAIPDKFKKGKRRRHKEVDLTELPMPTLPVNTVPPGATVPAGSRDFRKAVPEHGTCLNYEKDY